MRLVSMFLNYSTLESGKLVLHMRDNDLRDCLLELATRWNEAFQRKHVRLEICLDETLPVFKFDYQKVQQAVANLLDNALKHTPAGGGVVLRAERHFWERRSSKDVVASSGSPAVSQPGTERGARVGYRYRGGHRIRAPPGNFRGFRARGPHLIGHGPGVGHRQAAGAGAPREDLGGQRAATRMHVYFLAADGQSSTCGYGVKGE